VELLLSYADQMPSLPERLQNNRDSMELVEECMTPYTSWLSSEMQDELYFDVPQNHPLCAVLLPHALGLEGAAPQEVLTIPNDFFYEMGLESVLSMQRLNGMSASCTHEAVSCPGAGAVKC